MSLLATTALTFVLPKGNFVAAVAAFVAALLRLDLPILGKCSYVAAVAELSVYICAHRGAQAR